MHLPVRAAVLAAAVATGAATTLLAPSAAATTNDPLRSKQYGLDQVHAEQAWPTTTGTGAVVAVVDTGVDFRHPDLQGQLLQGATFTCPGKTRPCGNGDWVGPDGQANEEDTHGTHVSGIIAAVANNGIGVAGVAPGAKILPVKVLEQGSGDFADIADGIRYAADHGADVINMSLGALPGVQALTFTGVISDTRDAIAYARSKGVVVVASAGNESFPLCDTPAFEDGALCVTSTDKREAPSYFSNGGLKPDLQAVAAPGGSGLPICGEDIVSTVPLGTGNNAGCGYGTDYDEYAGTSMAAPHVSGVAALLAARGLTDVQILDVLLSTSRQPVTGLTGVFTPSYGWGIVDAAAAVAATGGATATTTTTSGNKGGKGGKH